MVLFNLCHFGNGGCVARLEYTRLKKSNNIGDVSPTLFWGRCDVIKGFGFLAEIYRDQMKRFLWTNIRRDFQAGEHPDNPESVSCGLVVSVSKHATIVVG